MHKVMPIETRTILPSSHIVAGCTISIHASYGLHENGKCLVELDWNSDKAFYLAKRLSGRQSIRSHESKITWKATKSGGNKNKLPSIISIQITAITNNASIDIEAACHTILSTLKKKAPQVRFASTSDTRDESMNEIYKAVCEYAEDEAGAVFKQVQAKIKKEVIMNCNNGVLTSGLSSEFPEAPSQSDQVAPDLFYPLTSDTLIFDLL